MPPRTIDNLGIDASARYAEDKKNLDETLIKEARAIPIQTEIDVTTPAFPSELDALFDLSKRHISWADFYAPDRYNEQKKRLFTFHLIPSLGSDDRMEAQAERITAALMRSREARKKRAPADTARQWQEEREEMEEEKAKNTLLRLLEWVKKLDKSLVEINGKRSQYHKG
jgi:hypothetical protein